MAISCATPSTPRIFLNAAGPLAISRPIATDPIFRRSGSPSSWYRPIALALITQARFWGSFFISVSSCLGQGFKGFPSLTLYKYYIIFFLIFQVTVGFVSNFCTVSFPGLHLFVKLFSPSIVGIVHNEIV